MATVSLMARKNQVARQLRTVTVTGYLTVPTQTPTTQTQTTTGYPMASTRTPTTQTPMVMELLMETIRTLTVTVFLMPRRVVCPALGCHHLPTATLPGTAVPQKRAMLMIKKWLLPRRHRVRHNHPAILQGCFKIYPSQHSRLRQSLDSLLRPW
tara:strand:+ start:189 stop:650 length:462 start_codon:yes stop_codon:yes gene_type:complete